MDSSNAVSDSEHLENANSDAVAFYDQLAPLYHVLYPDWEESVERQGAALSALLFELGVEHGARVHDAACGIGTQIIGLARAGFQVTASDISPVAVRRAQTELAKRQLAVDVAIADMRELVGVGDASCSAIIACDNAVTHLESDAEIRVALQTFHNRLAAGGAMVISLRDYDNHVKRSPEIRPCAQSEAGERRILPVQVWTWDGDHYDLMLYLIEESGGDRAAIARMRTRTYAVTTKRLMELMREVGFKHVERRDGVLFQPVIVGTKG